MDDKCGFTCSLLGVLMLADAIYPRRWLINNMIAGREDAPKKGGPRDREGGQPGPLFLAVRKSNVAGDDRAKPGSPSTRRILF